MQLKEYLRLARPYFVLLAIFTIGRWIVGLKLPYPQGSPIFSLVILTILSCLYFSAFARRWRGYRIGQAVVLSMLLSLASQIVIVLATLLSYLLGVDTYFNHPTALNATEPLGMGQAMVARAFGLVVNTLVNGSIAGALGWAMGGLLPEK